MCRRMADGGTTVVKQQSGVAPRRTAKGDIISSVDSSTSSQAQANRYNTSRELSRSLMSGLQKRKYFVTLTPNNNLYLYNIASSLGGPSLYLNTSTFGQDPMTIFIIQ